MKKNFLFIRLNRLIWKKTDLLKYLFMIIMMLAAFLPPLYGNEWVHNSVNDFGHLKKRQAFAFLVGNNQFEKGTFQDLSYCIDDVLLFKGLLSGCVKVPEQNIHGYFNIGEAELKAAWKAFVEKLTPGALVIIYFSTHGREKGSLVLSDSSLVTPGDLRRMVNGIVQDTVLIVDACYSGDGENATGLEAFKKNSLRLYSSLGYSPARELKYEDSPFLRGMKDFFEELPGVPPLRGNGYFTALIGNFFAQYPFEKEQNVSFFTFFAYLSGRGRDYLEYLGQKKGFELSELELSVLKESKLPKMEPIVSDIPFHNPDNRNIILSKKQFHFWPEENFLSASLSSALAIILNKESWYNTGAATMARVHYNFNFREYGILGLGFKTGYSYNPVNPRGFESGIKYHEAVIPITLSLAYATHFTSPLQITAELYGGYILWHNLFYSPEVEELSTRTITYQPERSILGGGFSLGAVYSLSSHWYLGLNVSASYFSGVLALYPGLSIRRIVKEF